MAKLTEYDLRYLTRRHRKDGTCRRFWQRKGHKIVRLPDPRTPGDKTWCRLITELNRDADQKKHTPIPYGSMLWAIDKYRNSSKFLSRSKSTRRAYTRWLDHLVALAKKVGNPTIAFMTRKACVDYIEKIEKESTKRHAAAVLQNILKIAVYEGLVAVNHAKGLEVPVSTGRKNLASDKQIEAFLGACVGHSYEDTLVIGTQLLRYTGQRPGDILGLPKKPRPGEGPRKEGGVYLDRNIITLVQEKTDQPVVIPIHRALRPTIERAMAMPGELLVPWPRDTPLSVNYFQTMCERVRAGIKLKNIQNRDYRRMAVVKLAEAGCTSLQIAAITGHTLTSIESILQKHYFVRTEPTAREAVTKWEESEKSNDTPESSNTGVDSIEENGTVE